MGKQSKKHKDKDKGKAEPKTRTLKKIPESSPPSGRLRHQAETGERDETYDLVSVLYHALQGAETCGTYLRDAEAADDEDLAEFFEDTRAEHVARASLAKQHLLSKLLEAEEGDEEEDDLGAVEARGASRKASKVDEDDPYEDDEDRVEGDEVEDED